MIPFCEFVQIQCIFEQWKIILIEQQTDIDPHENIIFTRDKQYVSISKHGNVDRLEERKWWNDYTDEDFTSFAENSLNVLRSRYKQSSYDKRRGIQTNNGLLFVERFEVAFVVRDPNVNSTDPYKWKHGLIGSLRQSLDKAMDSYNIVTILSMKDRNFRLKDGDFEIELISYKTKQEKKEELDKDTTRIDTIKSEIDQLQLDIWDAEYKNDSKEAKKLTNKIDMLKKELKNLQFKYKLEESNSFLIKDKNTDNMLLLIEL
jgi:hypothetical protein